MCLPFPRIPICKSCTRSEALRMPIFLHSIARSSPVESSTNQSQTPSKMMFSSRVWYFFNALFSRDRMIAMRTIGRGSTGIRYTRICGRLRGGMVLSWEEWLSRCYRKMQKEGSVGKASSTDCNRDRLWGRFRLKQHKLDNLLLDKVFKAISQ